MRTLAFIDNKNITDDWIYDMFDYAVSDSVGNNLAGFIKHIPVCVSWDGNVVLWRTFSSMDSTFIINKLMEYENDNLDYYSEITQLTDNAIIQTFYYK